MRQSISDLPYAAREFIARLTKQSSEFISEKPAVVIAAVVAAIVLAGAIMWWELGSSHYSLGKNFLVDERTLALVGTTNDIPPIAASDGQLSLVYGFYKTCSDCSQRQLVYLMKYTDKGKAALLGGNKDPANFIPPEREMLVRLSEANSPWVPAFSPAGQKVMQSAPQCSGSSVAKPCSP